MTNKTAPPKTVYEGRYLRMIERGTWEYVERTHATGLAAIIIAVTPEDKVVFVEQFRVPLGARTIEMLFSEVDALSETADERGEELLGLLYEYAEAIAPSP